MDKTTYTASNGVAVVMHGAPSKRSLTRAAAILMGADKAKEAKEHAA